MSSNGEPTVPNYTVEKLLLRILGAALIVIGALTGLAGHVEFAIALIVGGSMSFAGVNNLGNKEQKAIKARNEFRRTPPPPTGPA